MPSSNDCGKTISSSASKTWLGAADAYFLLQHNNFARGRTPLNVEEVSDSTDMLMPRDLKPLHSLLGRVLKYRNVLSVFMSKRIRLITLFLYEEKFGS